MRKMRIVIACIVCMSSWCCYSQGTPETGKAAILEYLDKIGQFKNPDKGVTYFMDVRVTSFTRDLLAKPTVLTLKVYLSSQLLDYHSDVLTVFQDKTESIFVVNNDKRIYRRNLSEVSETMKMEQTAKFQMNILAHSNLVSDVSMVVDGTKYQRMTFDVEAEVAKQVKIRQLEFIYNPVLKSVKTIVAHYNYDNPVAMQQTTFNSLDFNFKGKTLSGTAYSHIFSKGGSLRDEYKGFQLIDNRKK